ncbi:hypothetical protein Pta02_70130 [Planobispora takensis]|uniref:Uncharacterized protein n=1 Tax=Planobispora takensis TaxID=1367882 RepID=A0A8J3WX95_9ACTN|nr:hypothetical protein Pta02_70130 [Planobispora takensis]
MESFIWYGRSARRGIDDDVVGVAAGPGIEVAAAGDQPQTGMAETAVDPPGGEIPLGGFFAALHGEGDPTAIASDDLDGVPGRSWCRPVKTAGPVVVSTRPRMTAGPISPGVGPCRYQPVRFGWSTGGTPTVPSGSRPTEPTEERSVALGRLRRPAVAAGLSPEPAIASS